MPNAAVLIADNNLHQLRTCQEHLENNNCLVHLATSPDEARRILESELQLDVAIIDIRLRDDGDERDTSGLQIAKLRPDVSKIILTAYPDYRTTRTALNRHLPIAHEYLAKSEGLPKLMSTINWVLESASLFNVQQDQISRTELSANIRTSFNQEEFNSLLFHLQEELRLQHIDQGNLKDILADNRSLLNKIEATIGFLEQRRQLVLLLHLCRKFRPNIDWHKITSS